MLVSYFANGIRQTIPTEDRPASDIVKLIQSDLLVREIDKIRACTNESDATELKCRLPYVTWSGSFKKRHSKSPYTHSGLLCLDIDGISETLNNAFQSAHLFSRLQHLPWIYAYFISPTGTGLKILVRINSDEHQKAFDELSNFFSTNFKISIDRSGRDVTRACFLSWDPNIYFNEESATFQCEPQTNESQEPKPDPILPDSSTAIFNSALKWTENKTGAYSEGNRNNFIYYLACQLNRAGVSETETTSFCESNFDLDITELLKSVQSAYKHHAHEHNIFSATKKSTSNNQADAEQSRLADDIEEELYREIFRDKNKIIEEGPFWTRESKPDKNGKPTNGTITLQSDLLLEFLQGEGFFQQIIETPGQPDTYQILQLEDRKITPANRQTIKQFIHRWAKKKHLPRQVRKKYISGSKTLFSSETFDFLQAKQVTFQRDTQQEAFLYFPDQFVRITANNVDMHPYSDLSAPIWRHQIINHHFTLQKDYADSEFFRFIHLALLGKEGFDENDDAEKKQNLLSFCSAIGYLLHGYKDPSKSFSIDLFDKNMTNRQDANGRTGKSLCLKMLNYVKPVAIIDCRATEINALRRPETFADINFHTGIVLFDDVPKNFPYDIIFPFVTSGIKVKRLYTDAYNIPFAFSPKVAMSCNYTLTGDGSSYSGRQRNYDFCNFFKPDYTPADHFGHNMGDDWDEAQWNSFYSFIIFTIQHYLTSGLIPFKGDYELNKLRNRIHESYYAFFEGLALNHEYTKDVLMKSIEEEEDFTPKSSNQFTAALRLWADYKGYSINPGCERPDKPNSFPRNRRDGVDYIRVCTKTSQQINAT